MVLEVLPSSALVDVGIYWDVYRFIGIRSAEICVCVWHIMSKVRNE